MADRTRRRIGRFASAALAAGLVCAARPALASSADELVLQARAHAAANEEDIAVRRYTDALSIESTNESAWLGLGEMRMRLGEPAEAERVYTAAMDRVPTLGRALEGRAKARWALGRHEEAEADLLAYAEVEGGESAFRVLADWLTLDGRAPAALAAWRRLLRIAAEAANPALVGEARHMVRALLVLVDLADPGASPITPDATRRAFAQIARVPR